MTPLRQRMLNDMQLRGLSPKTQSVYLFAVQQFATLDFPQFDGHLKKPV